MFERYSCNMSNTDSRIRLVISFAIGLVAVHTNCYLLFIVSLFLAYTAIKHFCFIYYFLNINERFSLKNYYLTFLPKYNPSAVFIFNKKGKIVFKNEAAEKTLPFISSIKDFSITNFSEIIDSSQSQDILFEHSEKCFKIEFKGVSKGKLLLAYLIDVTEVIQLNDAIEETQREVIYAMGEIGEMRSKETGNHVKRVAYYSKELALLYGLSLEEADKLQMASPMHDIGKVAIADAILNAPRRLSKDEFEIMKTHASLGYDMLKNSTKPILQAAAIVANEHHEKWDGSGYPNGKRGEDIHIYGRITAIADVFDALGSERIYKKAWKLEEILKLFKEESGKHFDPNLVKLFLDNLEIFLKIRDKFIDKK